MPILTISLVLYNNDFSDVKNIMDDFLSSSLDLFIYVIDNSDKSNSMFFKKIKNTEYIFNNRNLGYGRAHNIAIKKAIDSNSVYHLIVNPDIRFDKNTLSKLSLFMSQNENVGLLMPKVFYPSEKLQFLCKLIPRPKDLVIRRFFPIKSITKKTNKIYELRDFDYNSNIEIPYISGCFMFARTNALKMVNGFDERFFLYFEDLDLSRRVGEKWKTVFYADSTIYHTYKKESYKNNKILFYHIASSIKYFNKWGWFFDKRRDQLNKETLEKIETNK